MTTGLLLAFLLGTAVLACGGSGEKGQPGGPLPQADQFAFVVEASNGRLVFDPAELLHGETALSAAREDGYIGPGETLPNDFYIRNQVEERSSIAAAEGFQAFLLDGQTLQPADPISLEEFEQILSGERSAEGYYGVVPGSLPMHLTTVGEVIVAARQTYLP